jgi:predicted secreted protein
MMTAPGQPTRRPILRGVIITVVAVAVVVVVVFSVPVMFPGTLDMFDLFNFARVK